MGLGRAAAGRPLEAAGGAASQPSGNLSGRGVRVEVLLDHSDLPDTVDESLAKSRSAVACRPGRVEPQTLAELREVGQIGVDRWLTAVAHSLSVPPLLLLLEPPPKTVCSCRIHRKSLSFEW